MHVLHVRYILHVWYRMFGNDTFGMFGMYGMLDMDRPSSVFCNSTMFSEKIIFVRILQHITDNDIIDGFQSAYEAGHSCETALLRVYNDIVITIGKGNGSFLVLLDLSYAFDTIDHLFMILERFVGISGSALQLIKSYFSGRTQRVVIDGILSDFANLVSWGASRFCFGAHEVLFVFVTLLCHLKETQYWLSYLCGRHTTLYLV